jgi:hypothetical protein
MLIAFVICIITFIYYGTLNLVLSSLVIDMRWILLDEGIQVRESKLYFSFKIFKIFLENQKSTMTPEKEKESRNVYKKALRHRRIEYFIWLLDLFGIICLIIDCLTATWV